MSIDAGEYRARQRALADAVRDAGLDGALVVSRGGGTHDRYADVRYLTGHYQPYVYLPERPPRWSGRSHTVAVLDADAGLTLCVSVPEYGHGVLAADDVRCGGDFVATVAQAVADRGLGAGALGLAGGDVLPVAYADSLRAQLAQMRWTPFDEPVAALRRRKSPAELALMRAAAAMGRRAVSAFLGAVRPGGTEAGAVAAAVASVVTEGGGLYLAAASSGPAAWSYTSQPLPGYSTRVLEAGDLVRFDLVASLDGYLTDFGRTVVVGTASGEQQELLDTLHTGLDAAMAAIRPGAEANKVLLAGDRALAERGVALEHEAPGRLRASYPPHWGHGLGLTWERPWFVDDEDLVLVEGMVLAVERSLTRDGVGTAAAEQNLVVTADGFELLTGGPQGRWS